MHSDPRTLLMKTLPLSDSTVGALYRASIVTVGQLSRLSEPEVRRIHGIGKKRAAMIRKALAEVGLNMYDR